MKILSFYSYLSGQILRKDDIGTIARIIVQNINPVPNCTSAFEISTCLLKLKIWEDCRVSFRSLFDEYNEFEKRLRELKGKNVKS